MIARIRLIGALVLLGLLGWTAGCGQTLAFPGADGYGKYTSGGRGGRVIEVTNLGDDGPGSLRAAINESGPRTVVFRVSGTIALKSTLLITNGDLTIAGQTAPGDGICVRNYKTDIAADNVIIRFLRFRMGDEAKQVDDALGGIGRSKIIVDHCSMSWGNDEVGSFYDNREFTLQWCIISESLYNSLHPKGAHGFGGIWGGMKASFHHNLLAHHSSRNPRFNGGRTSGDPAAELVDFRNNVVYNWGFKCAYGGEMGHQNMVANYFKSGPATLHPQVFLEPDDSLGRWFVAQNVVEGFPEVSNNNWAGGVEGPYGDVGKVNTPFAFVADTTQPARTAYEQVLELAGATLPRRDPVDTRIIAETRARTVTYGDRSYAIDHKPRAEGRPLGIIDSQSEVGGWPLLKSAPPPMDTDRDGMPDAWETAHGLDPHNAADGARLDASGYSQLEIYLNSLGAGTE